MAAEVGSTSRQYVVPLPHSSSSGTAAAAAATAGDRRANSVTYTLRGLREEEVGAWAKFCAAVFADKVNPPDASYFAQHFYNDPDRGSASLIRVAVVVDDASASAGNPVIVASCRVLLRRISLGNGADSVKAGGIGEVCTAENHRNRGLSAQLLQDSDTLLHAAGIQLSFLHSAPSFFPFYQKAGYSCKTSQWSEVTINCNECEYEWQIGDRIRVRMRLAHFPNDTEQLMSIHQSYSESRYVGCIVRSKEYWEQYVSVELNYSLWLLEDHKNDKILGWMSIRPRGNRYQLREFGCKDIDSVPAVFRQLLTHLLEIELSDARPSFQLLMPTSVLREVEAGGMDSYYLSEGFPDNDYGWMYKQITDAAFTMPTNLANDRPHLIWPADSF
jgi:hypothetical protein